MQILCYSDKLSGSVVPPTWRSILCGLPTDCSFKYAQKYSVRIGRMGGGPTSYSGGVNFLSPPHYPDSCISPFLFLYTNKSQRINPKGRHDHIRRILSSCLFIDHPSFDGM